MSYYRLLSTLLLYGLLGHCTMQARSPHRPKDATSPTINVHWSDEPKNTYTLSESHLDQSIFNYFDKNYLMAHLMPQGPIPFRYDATKSVTGAKLADLIEDLLEEIMAMPRKKRPKKLKNFTVLKMRDVDSRRHAGLYVLKFNDYPFILKLFIESPESFIQPREKGFEPTCFYYMGGGVSRHLTGLTRIRNMEEIKELTAASPYWKDKLDFPRKWFWLPKHPRWMTISSKNIGPSETITMEIPAMYAVICDEIIWSHPLSMSNEEDRQLSIKLSNFLDQRIDLHINNFGKEKNSDKVTPIDFEDFRAMVGLHEKWPCDGYFSWYRNLSLKMVKDMLFRNKYERRSMQYACYKKH